MTVQFKEDRSILKPFYGLIKVQYQRTVVFLDNICLLGR